MIGKALLSGLWVCLECRSLAVIFTLDLVSLSCFTAVVFLTTLVATRRCRCLLQSVRVNVMPWRLLFVISGILAGGIPGFRIELCCFLHLWSGPLWFCGWSCCCLFLWACVNMAHKLSLACAEMILSYHLLLQLIISPLNWNCHVAWWFVLVFAFCVCWFLFLVFCCFVSWCFVFCFPMNVTVHRTMCRSSTSLLLRPLQHRPLRDLINQLIPNATCFETCWTTWRKP